jgi:pilus assembly protein Flp/PilA
MRKHLMAFLHDETGLTMVEYAVAGALVAAACVIAFTGLGTAIAGRITGIAATITG